MKFLNKKATPESSYNFYSQLHNRKLSSQHQRQNKRPTERDIHQTSKQPELKSLRKLKKAKNTITIKPANKNLGTVILNTEDYIDQCIHHLSSNSYLLKDKFPDQKLCKMLQNILINFKTQLSFHRNLYQHLQQHNNHTIPKFYGLPKIHKPLTASTIPPIRPIVSHHNSLLSHSAQQIDHVLQPLGRSCPDYLHNSTSLIEMLSSLNVPKNTILVTLDVISIYPSIPQNECLNTIHHEMFTRSELLIFDN